MNIFKFKKALLILLLSSISSSMFALQLPKGNLFPLWWSYNTEATNKRGSQTNYYTLTNYPAVFPIYVTKERTGREFNKERKFFNKSKPEKPELRYYNIATWTGIVVGAGIALYKIKNYLRG